MSNNKNNNSRISRRTVAKASLLLPSVVAVYLSGCGGGNKSSSLTGTPSGTATGSGRVQLTIAWPARTSAAASRYLPAYAQSLVLTLNKKDDPAQTQTLTVNRPDDNPSTQTVDFPNELRVGIWVLTVLARASKDGGGTTVAAATVEIEVKLGQTADAPLTLASTISGLTIEGEPLSLAEGQSLTLTGRAIDRDGFVLLLPIGALTWSLVSGEAFGSVTPDGIFTAVKQGTVRVRLAETGAGISAESDITVKPPTNPYPQLTNSAWPKFRGDARNTGRSIGFGATGVKKWEFITGGSIYSSPAISSDGTVCVGSYDHKLYGLDGATGAKKWEFITGSLVSSSPAIGVDETVYVGSEDGKVYALDGATGIKKWEFLTAGPVNSSPAIGTDGTIYIGSKDGKVYALDGANGAKKWEFLTGSIVSFSSPAIGADGTVYIGSDNGKVYALDGANGAKKWEFLTAGPVKSSPSIGTDGTVYIGSLDKNVYALDGLTGAKKWEFITGSLATFSSPAIGADGTVYIGSDNGKVYALDGANGAKKWEFITINQFVNSSPAIGSDGTIYIGIYDLKVYALDGATGAKKWEFLTGSIVSSSAAVGSDGTVYIGSNDGKVYAIG